jgi:transposase InsO family protein
VRMARYLTFIIDLYTRRIVGWALDRLHER